MHGFGLQGDLVGLRLSTAPHRGERSSHAAYSNAPVKLNPKSFYHKSTEITSSDCGWMVMSKLFSNGILVVRGMKQQKVHPDLYNTEIKSVHNTFLRED